MKTSIFIILSFAFGSTALVVANSEMLNYQCSANWAKDGLKAKWELNKGCLIQAEDGSWTPDWLWAESRKGWTK